MSELALGQLKGLPINGNKITVPSGHTLVQPGMVLQVLNGYASNTISTTSTSYVDTGVQVTITPKYATSKIAIIANTGIQIGASNTSGSVSLFRDSINLGSSVYGFGETWASASVISWPTSLTFLDSPATTSPVVYKIRYKSSSGGLIYARPGDSTANITVMEIAA